MEADNGALWSFATVTEHLGQPQIVLVLLLSLLLPLSIFVGRRNVRLGRRRLIEHLEEVLGCPEDGGKLPPALELIRMRYLDCGAGGARILAWLKEIGIYLLPTTIFVLLSVCGFGLVVGLGSDWAAAAKILLSGLRAEDGAPLAFDRATALVVGAGFVGAYIWSIEYLILRVANFDLMPLSFLRTSAHILLTVFVAWTLRQVVAALGFADQMTVAAVLGIAFLSGLYPSLGVRVLIDRLPKKLRIKREVAQCQTIRRAFPLDLIDGIDSSIKFRLNQLEISDAQNLATAHPIRLYVESPFGLVKVIDWIAQAQLLIELGPERFLEARERGIRDMIAVLDLGGLSGRGRKLLQPLLLAEGTDDDDLLQAKLDSIAHKLHVRQLNHWWTLLCNMLDGPAQLRSEVNLRRRPAQLEPEAMREALSG